MSRSAHAAADSAAEIIRFLARSAPFSGMEAVHLEFIAERAKPADFVGGTPVLEPDQGESPFLYILRQGRIRVEGSLREDGSERELGPGECFPLNALLARRGVASVLRACGEVHCLALPAADFHRLMADSAPFREFCLHHIAGELDRSRRILRSAGHPASPDPLSSPLGGLVRREPVSCTPRTPIREVLGVMRREEIGSMLICDEPGRPVGIFTLQDLLRILTDGAAELERPVESAIRRGLVALPPTAPAYEAALEMTRHGIRHIAVVEGGRLQGVVSERDLFSLQQVGLRVISASIRGAGTIERLVECSREIRRLGDTMISQGVPAQQLTQFLSTLNDLLTGRVIELETAGLDLADVRLCWIAMGSEGRIEQTLNTDQDNGLIFEAPGDAEAVRERLLPAARRINEDLDRCGFPLCKGNIMAGNPQWCASLEEWQAKFAAWVHRADAPELLNAAIFFDFRALWGDEALARRLGEFLHGLMKDARLFLKRMAENALGNQPPLGVIRDFVTSEEEGVAHSLDLKVSGATLFVDAARVFALSAGVAQTNTVQRLRAVGRRWRLDPGQVEAWVEAFDFIQYQRLRAQQRQLAQGTPMTNRIDPDTLNDLERRVLKESLRQARKLQALMGNYFKF